MAGKKRRFTVNEVVSMLEDEGSFQRADIHILPPPPAELTDEDSGSEDEDVSYDNLTGRQLEQPATVTLINQEGRQVIDRARDSNDGTDGTGSYGSDTDEYEVPTDLQRPSTSRAGIRVALREPNTAPRPKRPPPTKRKWQKRDIPVQQAEKFRWSDPNIDSSRLPQTPKGLFDLFFDDDIIDMIVEQSIRYAGSKGNHMFTTTREEVSVFIAILLISGYSTVPRRRMYWSHENDVRNDAVANAMTRDRFDTMVRYIHLCDNANLDQDDKFAKVRPLLSLLNERFLLYFPKQQNLSIDESMIPYYGRHGAKQFIRGKPIRFGYKMWALTTPLGYLLQFEPYQGARGRQAADSNHLGMGGAVVMDLLAELNKDNSYHLTFDNLFTSLRLVDELTKLGIACTGTIRSNRVEDCPVRPVKEMGKSERGSYDKAYDANNELVVVRWNDNNIVNVVSNVHGVEPVQTASRWSRAERKRIRIQQPYAIRKYNQTMGGVDRMDQNVGKYRISIRSKKWWWPVFAYCIDLTVQQTWHLYRTTEASRIRPLDLLGIRRELVTVLLACARGRANPGRPMGRPRALSKRVPDEIRLDGKDHYPRSSNMVRSALCGKQSRTMCSKCTVGVHQKCFEQFHMI